MSIERTDYEYDNSAVKMTHCPFCRDRLCGSGWVGHIEDKPECREVAYNRVEELASGTHRRDLKDSHSGRGTVQATL